MRSRSPDSRSFRRRALAQPVKPSLLAADPHLLQDIDDRLSGESYTPANPMGQYERRHPAFYFGRPDEIDQVAVQGFPLHRVVGKLRILAHFLIHCLGAGPNLTRVRDLVIKDPFPGLGVNIGDRGRIDISGRDSVFDGLPYIFGLFVTMFDWHARCHVYW